MRLFVAFRVPGEPLKKLQEKLSFDGVTLVKDYHCTLKFLGDVDGGDVDEVVTTLKRVDFENFRATFDSSGFFPNEHYIRVLWVGLKPSDRIIALHEKIDLALEGLFRKEKDFVPHVTLGRVKFLSDKEGLKKTMKEMNIPSPSFAVKEFLLMKSVLLKDGPQYSVVETFRLT